MLYNTLTNETALMLREHLLILSLLAASTPTVFLIHWRDDGSMPWNVKKYFCFTNTFRRLSWTLLSALLLIQCCFSR